MEFPHGALLALGSGSRPNREAGALSSSTHGASHASLALHRGNKRDATNACVRLPLRAALDALAEGSPVVATPPLDIRIFDLGAIRGVPLCFTDGVALPDGRVVFTAVAEDTEDSYEDSRCLGAAVGLVDVDGRVCALEHLEQCHKIEGVAARLDGGIIHLLLVTDPDDPALPAAVLAGTLR